MRRFVTGVVVAVAVLAAIVDPCHAQTLTPQQITPSNDGISERWDRRNSTTSRGQILFFGSDDRVYLFDGTSFNPPVQLSDAANAITSSVFGLGSGSTAGSVVGGWRRGAGYANVYVSGGTPQQVNLNPEAVAIGEGCLFMVMQEPNFGNHVFKIDPASGNRTKLSSGTLNANTGAFRVFSSGCSKAVWTWQPTAGGPVDLQYWNGTSVTTVATDVASPPSFAGGWIVYSKVIGGIEQVFAINTNGSLTPVQLSAETDATKALGSPQTDGRHVAWYRHNANGTSPETAQLILNGGLVFPTGAPNPIDAFGFHFQLHRGQLLWKKAGGTFAYDDGRQAFAINPSPATSFELPWLTDGFIAFLGLTPTGGTDKDVFRITATAPADAVQPSPPLLVVATPGTRVVRWDSVLGATSYNAYVAYAPGVTNDNYLSLAGGRKITGVTSGLTIPDVPPNTTYYVAITSVEGASEGPSSRVASTTFIGNLAWQSVGGLSGTQFYSVAADATNELLAYAGANGSVYKSSDGGINWTQVLSSATTGSTVVRALAVSSPRVFANTNQGDIWRSANNGQAWGRVLDDTGNGFAGALVVDPADGNVVYAGNFDPPNLSTESTIVRSINGGDSWTHTAQGPSSPDEIQGNALAAAATTPTTIYAGANGTPNAARTVNGGASWTSAQIPSGGQVQSLAVHPSSPGTVYAATRDKGVFKSVDGGANWTAKNSGLAGVSTTFSGGAEFNSILVDPENPSLLHLGAGNGYWFSLDAGESWQAANSGFAGTPYIYELAMTPGRRLLAATDGGLYMLSFAPAPTVTNVSPASGSTGGGASVTITGSGFKTGAGVTFGGTAATGVVIVNATTITATTPAHAAGAVAVTVTNTDGQSGTLSGAFTYTAAPNIPTGVAATAQTATSINVVWQAVSGATSYQVWRKSPGGDFTQIATPAVASFTDSPVSADTSHQYRIRAVNGSGASADSAADLATTVIFTNDPLGTGTIVGAAHLAQLRTATLAVRQLAGGLPSVTFTDAASPGVTVRAIHLTEIRSGLDAAFALLGLSSGGYTDPSPSGAPVKAIHFQEIRARVK